MKNYVKKDERGVRIYPYSVDKAIYIGDESEEIMLSDLVADILAGKQVLARITQDMGNAEDMVMSQRAVTSALANINNAVSVDTLPPPSVSTMHKVYYVPLEDSLAKGATEAFITIENDGGYEWLSIGTTDIDAGGKQLSENDFTDADKEKLQGIEDNAQRNEPADWAAEEGTRVILNKPDLTQFITRSVNDLVHYYTTERVYNKGEIDTLLGTVQRLSYVVVEELPEAGERTMGKMYLVPTGVDDAYDEYLTVQDGGAYHWVKISKTSIDLGPITDKLDTIERGAQRNVQSDWNATTGATAIRNKPTIPTELSQLSGDATHRTVSDAEKTAWNNKSDFSGSYTDLRNKPDLSGFVTRSTTDLLNYYLKSETFTKDEVREIALSVSNFSYMVAAYLPTASQQTMNIIYLIASSTPGVMQQYITVEENGRYSWTNIGDTQLDLSGYATEASVTQLTPIALTQAEYDNLPEVDPLRTYYILPDE